MEYIKNNYLHGTGSGDTWHVNIDPPNRKVKTYYEETITAIEDVYANKTGKFTVLLSGGLDSQYVCEVLLELKIDFDVVIIEYMSRDQQCYNFHDLKWAYEFCDCKNIKPKVLTIDFHDLVESGKAVEIARSIQCCSCPVVHLLSIIDRIDGFVLMGNDPPYLRYDKIKDIWLLEELQYIHGLLRYFEKHSLNGCPFLLSYTAEMMLSFLLDPNIQKLGSGLLPGKLGSNSTKSHVFNNGSNFNMPVYNFTTKSRIKLHGFENIYRSPIKEHPNIQIILNDYWKIWNGEYLEPYKNVVERLSVYQ